MLSPRSVGGRCASGIAAAFFTVSFACAVQAEDGDLFHTKGLFFGAGGSYAISTESESKIEREACSNLCSVDVDESFGLNFSAGYRHSEYLWSQVEIEYFVGHETSTNAFGRSPEYAVITTSGNLIGGIAIGWARPFLLGGVGFTVVDFNKGGPSQSGLSLRGGAGVDFEVTEHITLNLKGSYVVPFQDAEDFDYVSIGAGLIYHF